MFKTRGVFPYRIPYAMETNNPNAPNTVLSLAPSKFESTAGTDTPGFWKKKKAGVMLPLSPYTQLTNALTSVNGSWSLTQTQGPYYYRGQCIEDGDWFIPTDWLAIDVQDYLDRRFNVDYGWLVSEAIAKIYSRNFDALTWLAELKSTAQMFRGVGRRLLGFIKEWKKNGMSNAWLEARYGWRLLLYDLKDISEVLSNLDGKKSIVRDRVGISNALTWSEEHTCGTTAWKGAMMITRRMEVSSRGCAVAYAPAPSFSFNPLQTAWEVIPFSFVLDWFFSIGTAISAFSGYTTLDQLQTSAGILAKVKSVGVLAGVTYSNYAGYELGSFTSEQTLNLRIPYPPSFIPKLGLNLGFLNVVDLMALVRQALSK